MKPAETLLAKLAELPIGASIAIANSGSTFVSTMSIRKNDGGKSAWLNYQSKHSDPVECLRLSIESHAAAGRGAK